jgi:hypothetical protein
VRAAPARIAAAAGTAGAGLVAAAAAYRLVGGLPGILYAAGLALAALFGVAAIAPRRPQGAAEPATNSRPARWRRKARIIAELELELATTAAELAEHRQALANLAAQRSREAEAARTNARRLEERIRDLEAQRDGLGALLAEERARFEQTLEELGGGIGRHGDELARLERELEALIAR